MGAFLRTVYPFLKPLTRVYYWIVKIIFQFINLFQRRPFVPLPDDDLLLISATDAAAMIREREITSTELVAAYISRIKLINPILNAVVENNFDGALREASEVDAYLDRIDKDSGEYKQLESTKPLLGVPYSIKDTYAVKGFHFTAGIVARKDIIADYDADVVKNLKEAGAILLAITNVPEAAFWIESSNYIYGRTGNAYDPRRAAGGSSGGEGALIGAAGSVIGVGSDLAGSVRIPSMFNGIFGLKPSENAISIEGHHPYFKKGYAKLMGNAGPMCRYAKDLSLFFRVLAGNEVAENRFHLSQPVSMRKLRFFYMEGLNSLLIEPLEAKMKATMMKSVKYFEKKYDTSVYRIDLPRLHHAIIHWCTGITQTKEAPFSYLIKNAETEVSLFIELIKNIFGKSDHTVATLLILMLDKVPEFEAETRQFLESSRDQCRREIAELLKDDGLLIFPSWPTTPPFKHHLLATMWNMMYTGVWNALRLPAIVCPMGLDKDGLPLSVQIIAGPDNDRLLIAAANDLEEGFGGWRKAFAPKHQYLD